MQLAPFPSLSCAKGPHDASATARGARAGETHASPVFASTSHCASVGRSKRHGPARQRACHAWTKLAKSSSSRLDPSGASEMCRPRCGACSAARPIRPPTRAPASMLLVIGALMSTFLPDTLLPARVQTVRLGARARQTRRQIELLQRATDLSACYLDVSRPRHRSRAENHPASTRSGTHAITHTRSSDRTHEARQS